MGFSSDNASYMTNAYSGILSSLLTNSHHDLFGTHFNDSVNENERKTYKSLCRKFKSMLTGMNHCTIQGLQLECQNVSDFWESNELLLSNLFALASRYCFMPNSSAAVERTFSYYNKVLCNERRNLEPKTLAETLSVFNSGKI